jgi:Cytotoxic translational repressor of toxin-antitoxin stability system
MTIEASNAFGKAYKKLDGITRRRVDDCLKKLSAAPNLPGLNVEKVRGASDNVRSCRVTRGIRVIYQIIDSAVVRLLYVGDHDIAYRTATFYWLIHRDGQEAESAAEDLGKFSMLNFDSIELDKSFFDDLNRAFYEMQLSDDLARRIPQLISDRLGDGTDGKAPSSSEGSQSEAPVNIIPSDAEGQCRSVLIAFCFDGDSFNDRFREIAYHTGIHCPETKLVIIVTSQWSAKDWKKNHERAFANLKSVKLIYFAGFGRLARIC